MKITRKILALILAASMPAGVCTPISFAAAPVDYSVSADYAARYPNGVISFASAQSEASEGDGTLELELIRMGGTQDAVSIELKAIDVTAKYGVDYTVAVEGQKAKLDEEYSGTLLENHLDESGEDFITTDEILDDEAYQDIIGYKEPEKLSEEETAELYDASVDVISDTLGIGQEQAEELLERDNSSQAGEADGEQAGQYDSSLHQFKDDVLGRRTAANSMNAGGLADEASLLGSNDQNLAAAAVNGAAVGAAVRVEFADGENTKRIQINIIDDASYEPQEAFVLGLCNAEGGAEIGDIFNASVLVNDNDEVEMCQIGFAADSVAVPQTAQAATVEIVRTGSLNDYAEVSVHTVEGTAAEGDDYIAVDGSSLFMPGEQRKTVIVPLKTANAVMGESKRFDLVLECEAYGAELGTSRIPLTINPEPRETETGDSSMTTFSHIFGEKLPPVEISAEEATKLSLDAQGYNRRYRKDQFQLLSDVNMIGIESLEMDIKTNMSFGMNDKIKIVDRDDIDFKVEGQADKPQRHEREMTLSARLDTRYAPAYSRCFHDFSLEFISTLFPVMATTSNLQYLGRDYGLNRVRLYPYKITPLFGGAAQQENKTNSVQTTYSIYDSPDTVIGSRSYTAGKLTLPDFIYRGCTFQAAQVSSDKTPGKNEYTLSEEARKRRADLIGYDLATGKSDQGSTGRLRNKQLNQTFDLEDFQILYEKTSVFDQGNDGCIRMTPVFRGKNVDTIHVDDYNQDEGILKIGGRVYDNEDVRSRSWHEGDELKLSVEAAAGYECNEIQIIRANGNSETVIPGDNVMLTAGMRICPLFVHGSITITVSWAELGTGEIEEKKTNLKDFTIASDHEFIVQGDGTGQNEGSYVFKNISAGEIVTLYAAPKDPSTGKERTHTGLWLRDKNGETAANDDMRFILNVGDAFAFQADSKDMRFFYYFNPKNEQYGGALVKGRVVSGGGSVKHPNNIALTPKNIDIAGQPVANASVSVLSTDPNLSFTKDGGVYYTNAVTDRNGYFTLYLPGGTSGLGYSIAIAGNNRLLQTTAVMGKGETDFILPYQNKNFQIDKMTLGLDMKTDKIAVGNTNIKLGIHAVIADGHRAQNLKLRSYDETGMPFKEWSAVKSGSADWTYETEFVPSDRLKEGGRLTVEMYDANGIGQGEIDTGYTMVTKPVTSSFTLPQFDPDQSVTLPVIGDVSSKFDLGSDSQTTPKEAVDQSDTELASSSTSPKNALEVIYGSGKSVKNAIKAAKADKSYATKDAEGKASAILSKVSVDSKDSHSFMEKKAETRGGKGKNAIDFSYELGVYMSMYTQDHKYYFNDLTLYASLGVQASTTQQFMIAGIPLYLKLGGGLSGQMLLQLSTKDGKALQIIDPKTKGYFNRTMLDSLKTAGVFRLTIKVNIGAGMGNPKIVSAGLGGNLTMTMDYQPWKEGGGIADFDLNAEFALFGINIKYNIKSASYGMFKTDGYTGSLDFSKVKNADKFKSVNGALLMSYDDGSSITTVTGSYEKRRRGNAQWEAVPKAGLYTDNGTADPVMAQYELRNAIDTITPKLLPLNDNKALLLMLADDNDRERNDCSALCYSIIDENGEQGEPQYLDPDGTFDCNLAAQQLPDGRILVVWSDLTKVFGDQEDDLGVVMNQTDLSYCIFSANGTPGEVKKLTEQQGCEAMPTIACDEATGKTVVVYTSTDYQTQGVTFGEENMDELGNFLYNSYSTVCFKILDETGSIMNDYLPGETAYADYEAKNGAGVLGGLRFLDVQPAEDRDGAAIDEMTAAAKDGKVYAFYSIDTDRDTSTDEDRELFLSVCDLSTMEEAAPVRLTDNFTVDNNPQAVVYRGQLQLFWNNNGEISMANLTELEDQEKAEGATLGDYAQLIETMDSAAQTFSVTVQPDGNLYLLWNGWEKDGILEKTGSKAAVYLRGYDPDFALKYGENEEKLSYGCWGNAQLMASAEDEHSDLNEISFLCTDGVTMMCYKTTNKSDVGEIESYDAHFSVFDDASSISMKMEPFPEYPLPGQTGTIKINGVNMGPLPSEKVTIMAQLIGSDGTVAQDLGTVVREGHFQTNGIISSIFDFTMPETPADYKVKATAWEDDLARYPCVEEFPLPYGTDITISDMDISKRDVGSYAITLEIANGGNTDLTDAVMKLETVTDDWGDLDSQQCFIPVSVVPLENIAAKDTLREYAGFDLPPERFNDADTAEIQLSLLDKNGILCASDNFYINRSKATTDPVSDIYINGSADPEKITVKRGESVGTEPAVMPLTARNGCQLLYRIEDSSVASVDASGTVTGLKKGRTKLHISAYQTENKMFVNSNGKAYKSDGTSINIDENGMITNLDETGDQEPVFTKTVEVTVTAGSTSGGGGGSNSHTVTFDTRGGSKIDSVRVAGNDALQKPEDPRKDSCLFAGWFTDEACTEPYRFDVPVTQSMTLYAKWTRLHPTQWENPFSDVKPDDWFYDAVRYACENKLFGGVSDTMFAPDEPLTRAMLVTLLYRAAGEPDMENEIWGSPFADVNAESWYGTAVYWARMNGIAEGYTGETFGPDDPVTREQIAAMTKRYASYQGKSTDKTGNLSQFTDEAQITGWARDSVAWAVGAELISGKENGVLDPAGNATRAETAAILQRLLEGN